MTDADVKRLEEEEYDDYVKKYKKEHGNNVEGLEKKREYADKQREAIIAACKSDVLILTGGPGTGKTTTVNGIIKMLKKHGLSVLCAAPTGRAAKRISFCLLCFLLFCSFFLNSFLFLFCIYNMPD